MAFRWPEHRVTQNRTGASDAPVGRPEHEVTIRSMRYPFTIDLVVDLLRTTVNGHGVVAASKYSWQR